MVKMFLMQYLFIARGQSCLFSFVFAVSFKSTYTLTALTVRILCTEVQISNAQEVQPLSKCLLTVSSFINVL